MFPPNKKFAAERKTALAMRQMHLLHLHSAFSRPRARTEADLFLAMQPGDGHFQTFGNGGNLVIHQITLLSLDSGNGGLIENDALGGQPASEVIL